MRKQVTRCVERVWSRGWWSNCACTGKFLHTDGKHYCGTHYPPNVQARRDKINEKHKAEREAWLHTQKVQIEARNETARKVAGYDAMRSALERANSLLAELQFSTWISGTDYASCDLRQRIKAAHKAASDVLFHGGNA